MAGRDRGTKRSGKQLRLRSPLSLKAYDARMLSVAEPAVLKKEVLMVDKALAARELYRMEIIAPQSC